MIKAFTENVVTKQASMCITHNPQHVFGLEFLLHTRLFFFKYSGGRFHIDFNTQEVLADMMYIVPPLHFQHIRSGNFQDFLCIDIDNGLLKQYHKQLLYFIKYNKQKSLQITRHDCQKSCYETLLAFAHNKNYDEQQIIDTIVGWIENSLAKEALRGLKKRSLSHIDLADTFLSLLQSKELTIESCKVTALALEMFCSERSLHRICIHAFGLSAKDIVKYHLAIKAIYLLSDSSKSVVDVARELGFLHLSTFDRYMRRLTGFTPSSIKMSLIKAGL